MPQHVCLGAMMMCPFGVAPSSLLPTPKPIMTSSMIAANIADCIPLVNVPPFGACICPGNPMFVAATAAAFGVPTPVPCIPVPVGPWKPGATTVLVGGLPALNNTSTLQCLWGGVITITLPGQFTEQVPP